MGTLRIWFAGLLAVGFWILSVYGTGPSPLPADAPATAFSAARADATLARLLGPEVPHPVGSPQAAALRDRLKRELDRLGIAYEERTQDSCYGRRFFHACGSVTNITAHAIAGTGRDVLLMAHTDSVARGPGAADDASGVAVILETLRALKARHPRGNRPVAALFTDGEEKGLLGGAAFARDPISIARTGAVVNVEARGNQGKSLLFQTSAGDAALIDLYAGAAPHPATSSLYGEIFRILPNDTDLTPFLDAGATGVNFAFIGHMRDYHTSNDRRARINPATLQHQGENVLAMTAALAAADPATLKSGNAIYLDLFNLWLPRLPASWALPLSLGAFLVIGLAGYLTPRDRRMAYRPVAAALAPLLLLLLCVLLGFLVYAPVMFSGPPTMKIADPMLRNLLVALGPAGPWPPNPVWLRWSLAFGVWGIGLFTARWAGGIACWLWFAGLGVVSALWLPGLSPYFLFPALVAAPLLLATTQGGRGAAYFISGLAALAVWVSFNAGGEDIMGIRLHLLFTLTGAFALLSLQPLVAGRRLGPAASVSLALALLLAVVAGFNAA